MSWTGFLVGYSFGEDEKKLYRDGEIKNPSAPLATPHIFSTRNIVFYTHIYAFNMRIEYKNSILTYIQVKRYNNNNNAYFRRYIDVLIFSKPYVI